MAGKEPTPEHKRIFKVLLYTRDDPETQGSILTGEAIEHEGQLWLVPLWLDAIDEAWSTPARLVCLSAPPLAQHLEKVEGFAPADYLLNYPIPIADIQNDDPPQTEHELVVVERPALKVLRPH